MQSPAHTQRATEDVWPRMIFRGPQGQLLRLKREIDITELAAHIGIHDLMNFVGNLNAIYGDHFYIHDEAGAETVTLVIW